MDASAGNSQGSMVMIIIVYAVIIAALYFFMIRPQSKKRKEEEAMRNNIEIGDEIVTIGGIVGRVVNINDNTDSLVIETGSDRTRMRMKKWAISSNETKASVEKKDDKPAKAEKKSEK